MSGVASARIGRDEQLARFRVALLADLLPPSFDRCHRGDRGVVIGAGAHESGIGGDVVDTVGDRFPTASPGTSCTSTSSGSPSGCHSLGAFDGLVGQAIGSTG